MVNPRRRPLPKSRSRFPSAGNSMAPHLAVRDTTAIPTTRPSPPARRSHWDKPQGPTTNHRRMRGYSSAVRRVQGNRLSPPL